LWECRKGILRELAITLAGSVPGQSAGPVGLRLAPARQDLAWPFSTGIWLCVAVSAW